MKQLLHIMSLKQQHLAVRILIKMCDSIFPQSADAWCLPYGFSSPSVGPITRVICKCFISGHACFSGRDEEERMQMHVPWMRINVLSGGRDVTRFCYFE